VYVWDAGTGKELPDEEEIAYRRLHTAPNLGRYRKGYLAARAARDDFVANFYLNLVPPAERAALAAQADVGALADLTRRAEEYLRNGKRGLAVPLLVEIVNVKKAGLGAMYVS